MPAQDHKKHHIRFIGVSPLFREIKQSILKAAKFGITILLSGETGTGKSLAAELIHSESPYYNHPFIQVSSADLTNDLFSSQLFGHTKGSFTGATGDKKGFCDQVGKGTLVLEDIDNLTVEMQGRLLTFLDKFHYKALGSSQQKKFNGKLILTTNKDLALLVKEQRFRHDLYHRVSDIELEIPPLRKRKEDIKLLIEALLEEQRKQYHLKKLTIAQDAMNILQHYDWYGNIRELEKTINKIVFHLDFKVEQTITKRHLDKGSRIRTEWKMKPTEQETLPMVVADFERNIIIEALDYCSEVRQDTAKYLGISRRTLQNKMNRYELS